MADFDATRSIMSDAQTDIHSCSYFCTRPACVLEQRDKLRDEIERLLAENKSLVEANERFDRRQVWWTEQMFQMEAERDALLALVKEALMAIEEVHDDRCAGWCGYRELRQRMRATIDAAKGKP